MIDRRPGPDGRRHDRARRRRAAGPIRSRSSDIQGAAHLSPLHRRDRSDAGIVTGKRQRLLPPGSDARRRSTPPRRRSVFTALGPAAVSVGDARQRPAGERVPRGGGRRPDHHRDRRPPVVTLSSSGNALPAPSVIGTGGRIPPTTVIEDDATGDVETPRRLRLRPTTASTSTRASRACASRSTTPSPPARPGLRQLRRDLRSSPTTARTPACARPAAAS